eukprot:gene28176-37077_t
MIQVIRATENYKYFISVGAKYAMASYIGIILVRRLLHWYSGMADYEILLDRKDRSYHLYGCNLNGIGISIISSLNRTETDALGCKQLCHNILRTFERPCFPQSFNEYAGTVGRDMAVILTDLDTKIRVIRRQVFIGLRKAPSGSSNSNNGYESSKLSPPSSSFSSTAFDSVAALEGIRLLVALQNTLTVLQAQQADAMLRLARLHLLNAANTCEDLLTMWKASLEVNSQKLRWPILKHAMSGLFGISVSVRSTTVAVLNKALQFPRRKKASILAATIDGDGADDTDDKSEVWLTNIMRNLNTGEKSALLEEMRTRLYQLAGEIQLHLDTLGDISLHLHHPVNGSRPQSSSALSSSPPSSRLLLQSHHVTALDAVGREQWAALLTWTSKSSLLCSKAIEAMSSNLPASVSTNFASVSSPTSSSGAPFTDTRSSANPEQSDHIPPLNGAFNNTISLYEADNIQYKRQNGNVHSLKGDSTGSSSSYPSQRQHTNTFAASRQVTSTTSSNSSAAAVESDSGRAFSVAAGSAVDETPSLELLRLSKRYYSHEYSVHRGEEFPISDFHLNGSISSIIESCFVREKALAVAIESKGGVLDLMHAWEPIDLYGSSLRDENSETWYSKCLYRCSKKASLFSFLGGVSPSWSSVKVFQVLSIFGANIGKRLQGAVSPIDDSTASLVPQAVYILSANVTDGDSSSSLGNGVQYFIVFEFFASPGDADSPLTTKTFVKVKLKLPDVLGGAHVDSAMMRDVKALASNWKMAAQMMLSRWQQSRGRPLPEKKGVTSWASRNTHICLSESQLLKAVWAAYRDTTSAAVDDEEYHSDSRVNLEPDIELGLNLISANLPLHRSQWRLSGSILRDLSKITGTFIDRMEAIGLKKKEKRGVFSLLRARVLLRLAFWVSVMCAGFELNRRSDDISWGAEVVGHNVMDFIERRLTTPTVSILNDIVLNKRTSLTDREALKDAKRSLGTMLSDYLSQSKTKISESERRRIVAALDMRPISEEYERQLRRPIANILSGRIARLVLIQLQFVKKELLVAMQAIVNLQLLAVTPALLSIFALQIIFKIFLSALRSTSRGRVVESDLRSGCRKLERLITFSKYSVHYHRHPDDGGGDDIYNSSEEGDDEKLKPS